MTNDKSKTIPCYIVHKIIDVNIEESQKYLDKLCDQLEMRGDDDDIESLKDYEEGYLNALKYIKQQLSDINGGDSKYGKSRKPTDSK